MTYKLVILLSSSLLSTSVLSSDEFERLSKQDKLLDKKVMISNKNLALMNNASEMRKIKDDMSKTQYSNIVAISDTTLYFNKDGFIRTYKVNDNFEKKGKIVEIENGVVTLKNGKKYYVSE